MQLKKSKTYKEQVEILRNKGLKIQNSGNVIPFLNHVNYYRFSGYFLPFISKTDKKFHDGTSFEQLENIYHFDSELRKLIMGTIDECLLFLNPFTANYVKRGEHIKA
ncbi:Abi family protein [Butyrivibrio fibrisolvens]|uniref:Abi family protein n=1 Tax=Butyrivibrio fibrisolvens TaxID=831 RepID=UPI00041BED3A|nr:Abi family protein [Butyrivibrio fibrisolvens]